jgi:hypothetical protein
MIANFLSESTISREVSLKAYNRLEVETSTTFIGSRESPLECHLLGGPSLYAILPERWKRPTANFHRSASVNCTELHLDFEGVQEEF